MSAAGPVLGHRHLQRGQLADLGVGDLRDERAVDDAHRQMPQEIHGPGMGPLMAGRHQFVQQGLDARSDALEGAG